MSTGGLNQLDLYTYSTSPNYFSASRIRYEITRGNFGGAFAVKNMTGAIYVAGPLDYETRKRVSYLNSGLVDYRLQLSNKLRNENQNLLGTVK